jgi:hypothetical protein
VEQYVRRCLEMCDVLLGFAPFEIAVCVARSAIAPEQRCSSIDSHVLVHRTYLLFVLATSTESSAGATVYDLNRAVSCMSTSRTLEGNHGET